MGGDEALAEREREQAEFDRLLERERTATDSTPSSGGGGGGGSAWDRLRGGGGGGSGKKAGEEVW